MDFALRYVQSAEANRYMVVRPLRSPVLPYAGFTEEGLTAEALRIGSIPTL